MATSLRPLHRFARSAAAPLATLVLSCSSVPASADQTQEVPLAVTPNKARALFAGGCFWCMEPPFDHIDGVAATLSGYTGGPEEHPSYRDVANGRTGHVEAVLVEYDPRKVTYEQLLMVFWRNINPTQSDGQFVDRGAQYRTGIFYLNETQKEAAVGSKTALSASGRFKAPIVTEIRPARRFWRAEEYHQDFYKKSPGRYYRYRQGSGRDEFISRVWRTEGAPPTHANDR